MMLQPILADHLPEIQQILRANHVERAFAFGSVCTDRFNTNSDIDLLVKFDEALEPLAYGSCYFKLVDALQNLLQRDIDLVTERSVKSPYFRQILEKTKVILYE